VLTNRQTDAVWGRKRRLPAPLSRHIACRHVSC